MDDYCINFTATDKAQHTSHCCALYEPYLLQIPKKLTKLCEQSSPLAGAAYVDKSSFGVYRTTGKTENAHRVKPLSLNL